MLVRPDQLINEISRQSTALLGCTHGIGVVSQDSGVDHRASLSPGG